MGLLSRIDAFNTTPSTITKSTTLVLTQSVSENLITNRINMPQLQLEAIDEAGRGKKKKRHCPYEKIFFLNDK